MNFTVQLLPFIITIIICYTIQIVIINIMGKTQTHQQCHKQNDIQINKSHQLEYNGAQSPGYLSDDQFTEHSIQNEPIILSKLTIRQNPFQKVQKQRIIYMTGPNIEISLKKFTWLQVIYHPTLFEDILNFLSCEDDESIMLANKRLYSQIYLHQMKRQHHWDYVFWKLEACLNTTQYDILSHHEEQSQHSMDLDRTQSFFIHEENIEVQVNKLDRVMKALSTTIPYFQGLNSIVAILLNFFDEDKVFGITKALILRSENIQNNCQKYSSFIEEVQKQIKNRIPQTYQLLQDQDLTIQYFAMKWVLGIFSYDLDRQILFVLYSMVYVFGLSVLKWFIVALFNHLESFIQMIFNTQQKQKSQRITINNIVIQVENKADTVNWLLKEKLKDIISVEGWNNILDQTKKLMIKEKFNCNNRSNRSNNSNFISSSGNKQGQKKQIQQGLELKDPCPSALWYIRSHKSSYLQISHKKQSYDCLQKDSSPQISEFLSEGHTSEMKKQIEQMDKISFNSELKYSETVHLKN